MSHAVALDIARGSGAIMPACRAPSGESRPATAASIANEWSRLLRRLGISPRTALDLARRAQDNHTDLLTEMLARSIVPETQVYREIARDLGLAFAEEVDPRVLRIGAREALASLRARRRTGLVQAFGRAGQLYYLAAPSGRQVSHLRRLCTTDPTAAFRIKIIAPSALRAAFVSLARPRLVGMARDGLFLHRPSLSARIIVNAWQGALFGSLIVALPVAFASFPGAAMLASHVFFSLFFLACVVLRLVAARGSNPQPARSLQRLDPKSAPVYTVLVALRHEAEIVPDLLVALGRLSWPREKLEIKFICEADDRATIAALRAHRLRPFVEIVEVPPGMPRTKPNALSFALPLAKGEFVVLYDAEDRPHPMQLVEAWERFRLDGPDLACLQAPIRIDNAGAGVLPAMFALEYAALFRRLLPYLSRRGLLMPLGGTSNHFRRQALEEVGAWDPYNVTEDADLGIRLARYGYRTETITLPTGEDAPDTPLVWLRQRTRWFKGWTQTWLVHMRSPSRLMREVGVGSFLIVQVLVAGMLVSALAHPLLLLSGAGLLAVMVAAEPSGLQTALLAIDVANIVCGYGAFLFLGWRALTPPARRGFWKHVLFTPVYWLMMSGAAWRALGQLYRDPHRWDKTPHKPQWSARRTALPSRSPGASFSLRL